MADIRILTESELRSIISLDLETIDCIDNAFRTLAGGSVVMPPILSMAIVEYNGEVDVKTAYVPGVASFAIKMSPGFFDNPKIGLPSTSGLMILFSAKTGQVQALLLDNGYLTDVRTAAAGAVAARHLSRRDSRTACVVGTGMQAEMQLRALCLVRQIDSVTVWGRNAERAKSLAAELASSLNISVSAVADLEMAASNADIVVTTTPSAEPLVKADWLRPGQHITAMGSDQHHKNELEPACLAKADFYVPDRQSQTKILGELHHAIAAGIVSAQREFSELGEIAAGMKPGRVDDRQITICDLTGTGVQDTAIATLAYERAIKASAGTIFGN